MEAIRNVARRGIAARHEALVQAGKRNLIALNTQAHRMIASEPKNVWPLHHGLACAQEYGLINKETYLKYFNTVIRLQSIGHLIAGEVPAIPLIEEA